MKLKFFFTVAVLTSAVTVLLVACGGGNTSSENKTKDQPAATAATNEANEKRGIGKFSNVAVSATLDKGMAEAGNKVYDTKCMSCHRLTEEKLVGPGWKGVTGRRKAEWVMNFVTNTDEMLNKDAEAQAMLELCMVRMPNQSLSDDDARHVYEFMRKNDGVK
jgi:cytochrome c2